jgi:hypothetical protein
MTSERYRVEIGEALRDRERILDLWRRSGFDPDESTSAARYDWFYLHNPAGRGAVYLLLSDPDGTLVGAVGAGPRDFTGDDSSRFRASVLVDFVVDPAHRTLFPALKLMRAAIAGETATFAMVYGLPDTRAIPIFRALRGPPPGTSTIYVRITRSLQYLRKMTGFMRSPLLPLAANALDSVRKLLLRICVHASDVSLSWHDGVPDCVVALMGGTSGSLNSAKGSRSLTHLRWRCNSPSHQGCRTLILRSATGKDLLAYFTCFVDDDSLNILDFQIEEARIPVVTSLRALALAAHCLESASVRIELCATEPWPQFMRAAGFSARRDRPCYVFRSTSAPAQLSKLWLTRGDRDS